ncbi:hypothetical protein L345_10772, partial [Ophiophagus hannah]
MEGLWTYLLYLYGLLVDVVFPCENLVKLQANELNRDQARHQRRSGYDCSGNPSEQSAAKAPEPGKRGALQSLSWASIPTQDCPHNLLPHSGDSCSHPLAADCSPSLSVSSPSACLSSGDSDDPARMLTHKTKACKIP